MGSRVTKASRKAAQILFCSKLQKDFSAVFWAPFLDRAPLLLLSFFSSPSSRLSGRLQLLEPYEHPDQNVCHRAVQPAASSRSPEARAIDRSVPEGSRTGMDG